MQLHPKWQKRFLKLASHIAEWSKDPSTQCGAVITRDKFIVSVGFNGFPTGTLDMPSFYEHRPTKYARVLHAEINAILSARQDLSDCSIFVAPFPPCSQCAAAIIQSGIRKVYTFEPTAEQRMRWGSVMDQAGELFQEAGVELIMHGTEPPPENPES